MPVVAVMAPLQISPRCIMVHESSGIRDFDDLKNMTIAMSNSNPFSYFLRKKLPLEGVKVVPYSGQRGPVFAATRITRSRATSSASRSWPARKAAIPKC